MIKTDCWLILLSAFVGNAIAIKITTPLPNSTTCAPLYGWSFGSIRPAAVKVKLDTKDSTNVPMGYIVYEFNDEAGFGVVNPGQGAKNYFCTEDVVGAIPGCTAENVGEVLMPEKNPVKPLMAKWMKSEKETAVDVPISLTGYYCVRVLNPSKSLVNISVDFQNPFGELPSEYRPLMMMSLVLALIYLGCGAAWSMLLVKHQKVIVDHQKYMAYVLGLSFAEMAIYYAFYRNYNSDGQPSSFLMTLATLMGATRTTVSLFILLMVSMGYGVVMPSLGDKAAYVYMLSGFYLLTSVANVLASLTMRTSSQIILLFSTLGVAIGGAAFMTWTFDSLKSTTAILLQRKQHAKLEMYEQLTAILKGAYSVTILCLLASIVFVASSGASQPWYAGHWHYLWLMTDGWQCLLNLVAVLSISYVFRPRSHNRTYGLEELASDPLEESDIEGGVRKYSLENIGAHVEGSATEVNGKVYGRVESGSGPVGGAWQSENPFEDE